jgi:NitT/TauT family transport system substrate-binding protein
MKLVALMKRLSATAAVAMMVAAAVATPTAASAEEARVIRVGEGPFITGGGFYVALEKGYFDKMGVKVVMRQFNDGALAVPSMISGELDITFMTAGASLFNSIAKGAPLAIFLDRGYNRPGRGYVAINVSNELAAQGVHTAADLGKLKGARIGIGALGSINQYNTSRALQAAGLDPRKDVKWITNVAQPDLMKMLGQKQLDATDLAYQFGYIAQQNGWGPIVATGDAIEPGSELGTYAVRRSFLKDHRETLVRFAMAYLQGVKEFNAAAIAPDANPQIVEILAKYALGKPELVKAIAPHWSYTNENGEPQVESIMRMQDYWADYYHYVEKKVPQEALFDLTVAQEATTRLVRDQPFGH